MPDPVCHLKNKSNLFLKMFIIICYNCYRLHNRSIKVLHIPDSSGSSGMGSTLGLFIELLEQIKQKKYNLDAMF